MQATATHTHSRHRSHIHPPTTKLFLGYVSRLCFRSVVFAVAVYLFVTNPNSLQFTQLFGIAGGFDFVDFVFLVLLADISTKFFPHARIAMGSLKQYREFHVPTYRMFEGGREGFVRFAKEAFAQHRVLLAQLPQTARRAAIDWIIGVPDAAKRLLRSIDVLRLLPFSDEQLSATEEMRHTILVDRRKEVVPVIVFWVVFNAIIGIALTKLKLVSEGLILLWVLFFALWDMVCVVLWCPLQLLFMHNRCCTTCQIFNWDAIMTTTPLLMMLACPFSLILVGLSLVVLVRWELTVAHHPERFDERTNASLSCANCTDKLCRLREPLNVVKTSL